MKIDSPLKVIYVMSLGHSGSTLLDMILSSNSKVIGLGEVRNTLLRAREAQNACTCTASWETCPVWSTVIANQRTSGPSARKSGFNLLIDQVQSQFSAITHLVDSSKTKAGLGGWKAQKNIDIRILFLFKDVRSFLASWSARSKKPDKREKDGLRGLILHRPSALVFRWYKYNRRMLSYLETTGVNFLPVSYEQLCFEPEHVLEKICAFTSLQYEGSMLQLESHTAHILRGNTMRFDPDRNRSIKYDSRWLMMPTMHNILSVPALRFNSYLHLLAREASV